jgi:hypothetical protein
MLTFYSSSRKTRERVLNSEKCLFPLSDLHRTRDDFFLPVIILGIKLIHVVSILTARCADNGLIIDVQRNPVPAGQLLGQRF